MSAQHLRAYIDRAHGLADELLADTARRAKVLGCEPTASGCLRGFVTRFGKLAFRRPLETAEIDTLVNRATADALDTTDQFRFAIEVLLSSSSFLYRVEVGPSADPLATLTKYELASRLSFSLWGRAPDAALLDQAAAGALDTAAGLDATMTAMLADARTKTFYEAFFQQWLGFDGLPAPPNPPTGWSTALLTDMTRETQQVIGDFAWGGKNLLDVLTANYTRPTAALSSYFSLPTAAADGTATFPAGHARANTGLLTHPSLLAAKRDGDLIAIRGNWLRRTFLCRSLSIPPDVAEALGEMLVGLNRVQIVQKRNTEELCKGCHSAIDPIGIGLRPVRPDGSLRRERSTGPFTASPSALPDAAPNGAFANLAELATKLRAMPEVSACLADKVFTYANGREPQAADLVRRRRGGDRLRRRRQQLPRAAGGPGRRTGLPVAPRAEGDAMNKGDAEGNADVDEPVPALAAGPPAWRGRRRDRAPVPRGDGAAPGPRPVDAEAVRRVLLSVRHRPAEVEPAGRRADGDDGHRVPAGSEGLRGRGDLAGRDRDAVPTSPSSPASITPASASTSTCRRCRSRPTRARRTRTRRRSRRWISTWPTSCRGRRPTATWRCRPPAAPTSGRATSRSAPAARSPASSAIRSELFDTLFGRHDDRHERRAPTSARAAPAERARRACWRTPTG